MTLRTTIRRRGRLIGVGKPGEVLVFKSVRIWPGRSSTVSADGFSLTVPGGALPRTTTATVTPVDPATASVAGPAVRFHIDGSWRGRVRVSLPLDPNVRALGPDYTPVLVHFLDGGGAQVLAGRAISVSGGRVSYETPSLSLFTSLSLPKASLPSLRNTIVIDLAQWLGHDLSTFLGAHTGAPRCPAGSASGTSTAGSAFSRVLNLDDEPALLYCASANGSTATWTLANNTGEVLIVGVDSDADVRAGAPGPSGDPLIDYVFARTYSSVSAGSAGEVPQTIAVPGGATVSISVPADSSASITVDESPLGTFGAFLFSQIGAPAGAFGDIYDAVVQCGFAPKATGTSTLGLVRCASSSTKLARVGPKVLETLGKVLMGLTVATDIKQQLGIGHRTGTLSYQRPGGTAGVPSPGGSGGGVIGGGGIAGSGAGGGADPYGHATPLGPTSGPSGFGLSVGLPTCSGSAELLIDGAFVEDVHIGLPGEEFPYASFIDTQSLPGLTTGAHTASFRCRGNDGAVVWTDPGVKLTITGPSIPVELQSATAAPGGSLVFLSGASAGPRPCPSLGLPLLGVSLSVSSLFGRYLPAPDGGQSSHSVTVPSTIPPGNYSAREACLYGTNAPLGTFNFATQPVTVG